MKSLTFGSDPEFMLFKEGRYFSAVGIVQGNKDNRISINDHQFFFDNVMAECAIKPSQSKQQAIDHFSECFRLYAQMVKPFFLVPQASQHYPEDQLQSLESQEAGCDPDNCAYEMRQIKPAQDMFKGVTFRSCGGHVHVGSSDPKHFIRNEASHEAILSILMLDLFLAVPSLYMDHDPTSKARRGLYGQAGRYRVKPYGMEYRSLGNFWLASPELVGLVYDISEFVMDYVQDGKANRWWDFDVEVFFESTNLADAWTCKEYDPIALKACIDQGDLEAAKPFLDIACQELPASLVKRIKKVMNEKTPDFYRAWKLA